MTKKEEELYKEFLESLKAPGWVKRKVIFDENGNRIIVEYFEGEEPTIRRCEQWQEKKARVE